MLLWDFPYRVLDFGLWGLRIWIWNGTPMFYFYFHSSVLLFSSLLLLLFLFLSDIY